MQTIFAKLLYEMEKGNDTVLVTIIREFYYRIVTTMLAAFTARFLGRNLNGCYTAMYCLYKSVFGIRILLSQTDVCYHDTDIINVIENVNDN